MIYHITRYKNRKDNMEAFLVLQCYFVWSKVGKFWHKARLSTCMLAMERLILKTKRAARSTPHICSVFQVDFLVIKIIIRPRNQLCPIFLQFHSLEKDVLGTDAEIQAPFGFPKSTFSVCVLDPGQIQSYKTFGRIFLLCCGWNNTSNG
ncbi:hypothetical protein CHARACLAT_010533 [Characodon lateralis]|uniref:Uncharacterized protein n=1 Tax=Characodon lateralis TaxID=208331 RepID=A0ABU7F1U7_9TELE|nr:hypothetical protein [Characodon lateralis]